MKKIWLVLIVSLALWLTPSGRAQGYGCGGYYGGGGCYSGGWCGLGIGLGLGLGCYGDGCGLSFGIGLPGLWAGFGIGIGGCGSACAQPVYPTPEPFTPNPPPMSAAQMAGHNTRNWAPPPGQINGPTYYWTAPPSH